MCFRITTYFSCGHLDLTNTICHDHRGDYLKGARIPDCDEFIDNKWQEYFVCDDCRREKPVVISKGRELPRLKWGEGEEEEVGEAEGEGEDHNK